MLTSNKQLSGGEAWHGALHSFLSK